MGSATFTFNGVRFKGKYSTYADLKIQVNYSESYTPNTTTVKLTSVSTYCSKWIGSAQVNGDGISFSGTNVTSTWGHSTQTDLDGWSTISNISGGQITVNHNAAGEAFFTISISTSFYTTADTYGGTSTCADSVKVNLTSHSSTLNVNPNGGTWGSTTNISTFTQYRSSTKTIANPTRSGKVFNGWTKSSPFYGSLSGTTYTFSSTDGKTDTLTASWKDPTCTLSYNANGGTGAPAAQTVTQGTATTISSTSPTRVGYSFDGWYANSSLTGTKYSPGGSITISSNTTLYAKWNINSYTLTTKRNNNNYGTVTAGGTINYQGTKSLTATVTTATGYTTTFVNWTISGTGSTLSSTTSNPTTFTMGTANATVTANFNRVANTYTVTFNGNGATNGSMSAQTFTYGTAKALSQNGFSRTNFNFTGWNTKADGTGTAYTNGQSISIGAANMTLYAQWSQATFQVTYNANAPSGSGISPSPPAQQTKTAGVALTLRPFIANQSVSSTATYTLTANLNGGTGSVNNGSATKTTTSAYNQTWWCTNSAGTGTKYSSQAQYTANAAATMYALWNGPATSSAYTCVLPTGNPTKSATATATFSANLSGATNTKTSQSVNGTCSLNGWYTAATGGSKITTSSQFTASTTAYAHYNSPVYSSKITTPDASQCYKAGSTLLGWSTSSAATAVPLYAPGVQFTPTGSITLYGVWGDLGTVYIGGDKYKILIYDGHSWDYYRAYIVNNNQWVAY